MSSVLCTKDRLALSSNMCFVSELDSGVSRDENESCYPCLVLHASETS